MQTKTKVFASKKINIFINKTENKTKLETKIKYKAEK